MAQIEVGKGWQDAFHGYEAALRAIVESYPDAEILELGAGRWPSFRPEQMPDNLSHYTVNDISADELSFLPAGYRQASFDVAGDVSGFEERYDVLFSRFLAEHVRDGWAMHRNVLKLLRPGGIAFHLIPTLFALPFVINKLLPEALTSWLLASFTQRSDAYAKFPAYYSACYGNTASMRRALREIGYSGVEIRSFYGHFYYEKIPLLREIEARFACLASRSGWSWCSSYAYLTLRKRGRRRGRLHRFPPLELPPPIADSFSGQGLERTWHGGNESRS